MSNFICYYKLPTDDFRVFNYHAQTFETCDKYSQDVSHFEMMGKNYFLNDEDLKQYAHDLYLASEELAKSPIFKGYAQPFHYINPFVYSNGKKISTKYHDANIEQFFKIKTDMEKIKSFDPIDKIEANWMRKCFNAGLQYSVKGDHESYGYDMSNFYASLLASKSLFIPTKKGTQTKLTELPKSIGTGYYMVKIISTDPNIKKLFSFSPHHVYTHTSLKHAIKLSQTYEISIDLVLDVEYNAYVYEFKDLIKGYKLFYKWYQAILKMKKLHPKNMLVKMLSSSLWGHLSRRNITYKTMEEASDMDIDLNDDCDYFNLGYFMNNDGSGYYKLHDMNNPYKYPLRLKCFLTALGRETIANVAQLQIDSVLRIHTDGICFDTEQNLNIENFIPESKTTGLITFPIRRPKQVLELHDE